MFLVGSDFYIGLVILEDYFLVVKGNFWCVIKGLYCYYLIYYLVLVSRERLIRYIFFDVRKYKVFIIIKNGFYNKKVEFEYIKYFVIFLFIGIIKDKMIRKRILCVW